MRLLYVCHRVPYPPDKGDRIRNYHVLRQLNALVSSEGQAAKVSLACLADEPVSDETITELNRLCERVAIESVSRIQPGLMRKVRMLTSLLTGRSISEGAFNLPALAQRIREWHRDKPFDAVICSASSVAPYLRINELKQLPGFVDIVDCDGQKWFDFAAASRGPKRWLYQLEGKRVQKLEREIASWAAASTLVSASEAKLFDATTGPGSATVATNGVDLDYFQPRSVSEDQACIFVGAMDYLPNVDAVQWFANEVWPKVREKFPKAEFRIVGRKPTPAVQELAKRPGIVVAGTVPDVRDYVAKAAVSVVPMRLSRGLQNKVLESLAMAKATIAAPPALAAISTIHNRDLIRAESAEEWVTAVCQLLDNPKRRQELGQNARQFVEENHDWQNCLKPLTDLIVLAASPKQKGVYA